MNNNNNNENMQNNSPLIFTKKINNKHKIIPLNLTINTWGITKHFPPATQEWFNSVYSYNSNTMKSLSIADKTLSKLVKSYFNFYFSNKVLKTKRIAMRFKRLAVKKIFVSKAEVKHTNSRVIITLYVYNAEKKYLNRRIKKLTSIIFPSDNILHYKNIWRKKRSMHYMEKIYMYMYEYNNIPLLNWFSNNASIYFKELLLERENFSKIKKRKQQQKDVNLLNRTNLLEGIERWIDISIFTINTNSFTYFNKIYSYFLYWVYIGKEYKAIIYYRTLLKLNNAKFNFFFIKKLTPLVHKIYNNNYKLYNNKKVEFNIVNLKTLYLNSDIFTQVITLKLKNRDNKLLKVLRSALYMVKLPKVNVIKERYHKTNIKEIWNNKVQNLKVDLLLNKLSTSRIRKFNKDILNNMLFNIFSEHSFINDNVIKEKPEINDNNNKLSLLNFLLKTLKNKNMAGARLEAKGRLTRRFTASRSVFKVRWKGGIRNIDSSYRGLSTVMLRGHLTSNLQYSVVNSKTRNGAFGLKGWIASK
jgi:hypothetical protein